MATYVFDADLGKFVDPKTRQLMPQPDRNIADIGTPMIKRGMEAHVAPSGAKIRNRKEMLDDCAAHGYAPYEPVDRPMGLTDKKLAKSRGERVDEATVEWKKQQQDKVKA